MSAVKALISWMIQKISRIRLSIQQPPRASLECQLQSRTQVFTNSLASGRKTQSSLGKKLTSFSLIRLSFQQLLLTRNLRRLRRSYQKFPFKKAIPISKIRKNHITRLSLQSQSSTGREPSFTKKQLKRTSKKTQIRKDSFKPKSR